jgi:hypothetical protein
MDMKYVKSYGNFIEELRQGDDIPSDEYAKAGAETSWQLEDGTLVTLNQIIEFLDDEKVPVVEIPTNELKHLLIEVERDPSRVEAANLDFPIIIAKYKNEYYNILDGQHRLVKSVKNKIKEIKCRVLDLENCPEEFKKVFIR